MEGPSSGELPGAGQKVHLWALFCLRRRFGRCALGTLLAGGTAGPCAAGQPAPVQDLTCALRSLRGREWASRSWKRGPGCCQVTLREEPQAGRLAMRAPGQLWARAWGWAGLGGQAACPGEGQGQGRWWAGRLSLWDMWRPCLPWHRLSQAHSLALVV